MGYQQGLAGIKAEFFKARDAFLLKYPQLVQNARVRLGTMYDPLITQTRLICALHSI